MMHQRTLFLIEELVEIRESVCGGKKSMKPWRTPGGPKKFAVCVPTGGGKKKVVRFGDPNLEIKRDSASRRKNFRARHGCGKRPNTKDPKKAGYWACKTWERKKTVGDVVEQRSFRLLEGEKLDREVPELAFKAREKARDDEKAGHKEGAEYWRGWAAGSFLTGNKGLERTPLRTTGQK